jgi:hypothetical protein
MSEEELAAEIEKQRPLNALRGFPFSSVRLLLLYSPECVEVEFFEVAE